MTPNYNNVEFLSSIFDTRNLTLRTLPEIIFVGKSNVGKSSAINKLLNRKKMARVSSMPGKTQAINYFEIDGSIYFVDLPGYGFAQRSKGQQAGWGKLTDSYFKMQRDKRLIVFLVDIRHDPTKDDVQMFRYLMSQNTPFCVVATKSDKLSAKQVTERISSLSGIFGVDAIAFSSETGAGVEPLRQIIEDVTGTEGEYFRPIE